MFRVDERDPNDPAAKTRSVGYDGARIGNSNNQAVEPGPLQHLSHDATAEIEFASSDSRLAAGTQHEIRLVSNPLDDYIVSRAR